MSLIEFLYRSLLKVLLWSSMDLWLESILDGLYVWLTKTNWYTASYYIIQVAELYPKAAIQKSCE